MPRIAPALVASLLVAACAFQKRTDTDADELLRRAGSFEPLRSDARNEIVYVDTVHLEAEQAFVELQRAYQVLGLLPSHSDRGAMIVAGQAAPLNEVGGEQPDHWVDCGTADPGSYDVLIWYASAIVRAPGGNSTVHSIVRADTRSKGSPGVPARACLSRGTLEAALAEYVRGIPRAR